MRLLLSPQTKVLNKFLGMRSFHPEVLLLFSLISLVSGLQFATSSFSQVPFLSVWNAPTASCLSQYGVNLDLGTFSIVQNQNQTFMGENITIFYAEKLGLYPRYSSQGQAVNGGVPQNSSLGGHLRAAAEDIHTCIPDRGFQGLAVVDWESWRPVWERNWDSKQVYWEGSRALVRSQHPDWSPAQVDAVAHKEFEEAGRNFMEETLKLGQQERPNGLWGFYGFPNCYNYYSGKSTNYTGECPPVEVKRNDRLFWLWSASSALYPDIYLSQELRGLSREVLLYTHHRILEAMRAGAQVTPSAPPVFPYARIVYTYTLDFLSQEHLVYTIGESAALGSAGVVLWGDHLLSKTQATCEAVKSYIDESLGPYLVNVTSAAVLCSQTLCSSKGRCQRRNPNSRAYLHLDPAAWKIVSEKTPLGGKNYRVLGQMWTQNVKLMKFDFECKCYPGWGGESCSKPSQG
ncbi:hyaluronidase-1 [Amphiprion ocellaris]|uniref:hyaluronidase-1 n=1 Tax=Amphiprion ocellaris TaxID=80972 RepID=UPI0024117D7E|nr:hyaluronidase-1 [Amphiprion ocellaris]XP_023143202.2 hyaluronidase-1 [Amphiprion ocellaris]XP_054866403.1 hyaluronidase-1 [Amphiprion ocellaris]